MPKSHFRPPDRLCSLCVGRMPPAETREVCIGCVAERIRERILLEQIRRCFPAANKLSRVEIYTKLWEIVWQMRKPASP